MTRLLAGIAIVIMVGIGVGMGVRAQDAATPEALGTPDTALCATPLAEATGSPEVVEQAPQTAATPGGVEPGDDIGLFPCATPVSSPVGSPVAEGTDTGAAAGGATELTVLMVDMAFQPTSITIPANTDVTISLTNNGVLLHNFTVDELGINSGDYTSAQQGTVTINAPAGTYEFYCSVPGHKDIGMVGTLIVE